VHSQNTTTFEIDCGALKHTCISYRVYIIHGIRQDCFNKFTHVNVKKLVFVGTYMTPTMNERAMYMASLTPNIPGFSRCWCRVRQLSTTKCCSTFVSLLKEIVDPLFMLTEEISAGALGVDSGPELPSALVMFDVSADDGRTGNWIAPVSFHSQQGDKIAGLFLPCLRYLWMLQLAHWQGNLFEIVPA